MGVSIMSELMAFGWSLVDNITSSSAPPFSPDAKFFVPKDSVEELKAWWAQTWSTDYRAFIRRAQRIDNVDVETEEVWTYKKFGFLFVLSHIEPGKKPETLPAGWAPFLGGQMHDWFTVNTGMVVPEIPTTATWSEGGVKFAFVRKIIKCIIVLWITGPGRDLLNQVKSQLEHNRRIVTIRPVTAQKFVCLHDGDHNRTFEDRFLDGAACGKFGTISLSSSPVFPVLHKIYLSTMLGDADQCIVTGAPFPVWLALAHEILHALKDEIAPDAMGSTGQPEFSIITGGPAPTDAVLRDFSQIKVGPIPTEKRKVAFDEMLAVYGRKAPQAGIGEIGPSENQLRAAYGLAKREKYHGPSGPKMAQMFIVPEKYSAGTALTQPDAGLTGGGLQELGLPVFAKK